MQIVIDIPEEDYRWIKEHKGVTKYQTTQMLYNRVRKCTVLHKGHGKIVDANCVLENGDYWEVENPLMQTEAIIETDVESERV